MKIRKDSVITYNITKQFDLEVFETVDEAVKHLGEQSVLEMVNAAHQLKTRARERVSIRAEYERDKRIKANNGKNKGKD